MKYKGDIKNFPQHVAEAMLDEQQKQTGIRDISEFETCASDGFIWSNTSQGHDFWKKVIIDHNFELIKPKVNYPKVMLVSNDNRNWSERVVFMKKNNVFISWRQATTLEQAEQQVDTAYWRYAKDIELEPKIPEYTMEDLFNKLGQKFIIKK